MGSSILIRLLVFVFTINQFVLTCTATCNNCSVQAPCCLVQSCCDKDTMGCCDGYGCVDPCESQFDAIGCDLKSSSQSLNETLVNGICRFGSRALYRILRPDENPFKGIVAKNPAATKSVLSHVNCGSRPKYTSQYISTTAELEVARYYKRIGEEKGLKNLRIAEMELQKLPQNCRLVLVDLTTEENRNKHLGNAVCKNFAKRSCEVLLKCDVPIPAKVIEELDKEENKGNGTGNSASEFKRFYFVHFVTFFLLYVL